MVEEPMTRRLVDKGWTSQAMEYYITTKKKEAALCVPMREDHQDRILGGGKSKAQNNGCRMLLFMESRKTA